MDHALCVLHVFGLQDAVALALQRIPGGWMPPTAHVDFLVAYGEEPMLSWVLQDSVEAWDYVLALPDAPMPRLTERFARARELARSARAQHSAQEAIAEIQTPTVPLMGAPCPRGIYDIPADVLDDLELKYSVMLAHEKSKV